jgi:ParB-like nuclease domain
MPEEVLKGGIEWIVIEAVKPNRRNTRVHSKKQIRQIANSIAAFGFLTPILIDEEGTIIAGHGRYEAARLLGLKQIPAIRVQDLSQTKRRALALADNKIAENAGWNRELLAAELPELAELLIEDGLSIDITGFAPVDIDQLIVDFEEKAFDPADTFDPGLATAMPVSKAGDLWEMGHHRILCGDARDSETLDRLMDGSRAAMAFLDPPYNVRVRDIVGRGRVKHAEFAMGSGELSTRRVC